MARIEDSYPTPIHGVSTLAPRNRARGQAGLQTNMRSDPVAKLTRRPSLTFDTYLLTTDKETNHHSYYRRERNFQYVIEDDGTVHPFVDGVAKNTGSLGTYGESNDLRMETVNDTTFVVNPVIRVGLEAPSDFNNYASYVNVTSALNYSHTLTVTVTDLSGNPLGTASITIGDGTDFAIDDAARATNAVAAEIATQLNGAVLGAHSKGSSVGVFHATISEAVKVEISDGAGSDRVTAVNPTVERVDGLPLYAFTNSLITVQPDPTTTDGIYYLKSVGLDGNLDGLVMEEVVWTEWRAWGESHALDTDTLPKTIRYDYDTDTFIYDEATTLWEERRTGDDESNPHPAFVGRRITAISQFQKRLVILSDNDIDMSRTDNLYNFWKRSAVNLLVTDPIGVTSNATGIDILRYVIEHNRDLMMISSNAQFKIDGTQGITPQTVSMSLTTSQEIQVSTKPVTIGTSVYLPINYGESTGVTNYTGNRDQQDLAQPITHHVIGYMQGEAEILVGSPNLEMLAMTTSGGEPNELFIYEQFTEGGKPTQQSWSTWTLPENNTILAMEFRRDKLELTVQVGNNIFLKSLDMYSRVAINTHEVFLDDMLTLSTDGLTCTIPNDYPTTDMIVVMGEGTVYPLEMIGYTVSGNTVTFSENIDAGIVYLGTKFYSAYQPTRPFVEDGKGIAVTTDRLRIQRFILNVVETESVKMRIDSPYFDTPDQELTPRIMNRYYNIIGEVNLFTGDYQFSYSQDANLATATFYTDGYLGMTIAGISWAGQYNKTSSRMS